MAGLFGLGGIGGIGGAQPPAGLLGPYFNASDMKKQQLKQGLLMAGIGLLTGGKGSTGEVLGQGLAAGLQGANNAGINYKNDVMGYQQLDMQMREQKAKQEEKQRLMDWVSKQPPEMQNFLAVNPEAGAKLWQEQKIKGMFPDDSKAPTVDTFYDEVTGQPVKRQWNPQTRKWENQGGVKADDNGITVGPDGTVQIGGPAGKVTEGMRRAKGFKASMKSSIENLQTNFEALTDPRNYLGDQARGIGGRGMMTPEGQMAADNFDEVVADALYIASGATLTAPEVERKKAAIIPTPNDSPQTIEAKRRRLADLVAAVDVMAGDPPGSGQPAVNQVAPQGIAPEIWNEMTPEQKALWN